LKDGKVLVKLLGQLVIRLTGKGMQNINSRNVSGSLFQRLILFYATPKMFLNALIKKQRRSIIASLMVTEIHKRNAQAFDAAAFE